MTNYKYYKQFCEDIENVENFEKAKVDNFVNWHVHHRRETHSLDGKRREVDISRDELIALDMYYNVSAEELIFLTKSEHTKLHSEGNKYCLSRRVSSETRKKIGEKSKGRCKGRHWYNNGKINKRCYECPEGFVSGRLR